MEKIIKLLEKEVQTLEPKYEFILSNYNENERNNIQNRILKKYSKCKQALELLQNVQ